MVARNPKYPYILAILYGILAPGPLASYIPEIVPFLISLFLIYLLGGGLFGFFWPKTSWRWGLWIVAPMLAVIALSVAFSGFVEIFLKKDLPLLIVAITSACTGSFVVAWFKSRRITGSEKSKK